MVELLEVVPSDVKAHILELVGSGLPTMRDTLEQLAAEHGVLSPSPPIEWAGTQMTKSTKGRCSKVDRNAREEARLFRRLTCSFDGEDNNKVERAANHEVANSKGAPNAAPSSAPSQDEPDGALAGAPPEGEPNKAPVEAPPEGEPNGALAGAPPEDAPEEAPPVGKKTAGKNTAPTIWKKLEVLRFMDALEPPPDIRRWQRFRLVMNRFPETVKNKSQLTRWQQSRARDHWDSLPLHVTKKHKELPNCLRTRVLHRGAKGSRGVHLPDALLAELDFALATRIHGLSQGLRPQEAIFSRIITQTAKKVIERYNARIVRANHIMKENNEKLLQRVMDGKITAARAARLAQDPKKCLTPLADETICKHELLATCCVHMCHTCHCMSTPPSPAPQMLCTTWPTRKMLLLHGASLKGVGCTKFALPGPPRKVLP